MSGLLPANTTLQLGDNSGNISHQGVLTSNVNGTTLLTGTFPTTSTGTSTCHAHYTNSSTGALKFLNASGTGEGGHEFYASNSTTAPVKTLEINKTAMLLNTALTNNSGNTNLSLEYNNLTFTNDILQCYLNNEAFAFKSGGASNVQINNSPENPNVIFTSATTNSQLTANDLTFGGVSLPTTVSSNTTNINTLKIKQTNLINVYSSPAMYADGSPPLPVPSSSSNTYGQFGFYFKNSTVGLKINWYMPPATGMIVSDILGLYMRYFNCSTTSNGNSPFIIVYTKATGTNDAIPNFAHSVMVYIINTTPVANTSYTMFMNASGTCPNPSAYASNIQTMIISPVNNPRGPYAPTESVLAIVIGSNSSSAVNSVEFIAQKLGVMTATGTQELSFMTLL
jgi:hypothetical protein